MLFVFTDSDVRLPRGWLSKLVAPLEDSRIGATTAYRWLIPSGAMGDGRICERAGLGLERVGGDAAGHARGENFCWGGGTAIRRKNFDEARVLEAWEGAVSDDFAMTSALRTPRKADRVLPRMPGADAASLDGHEPAGIHEPANPDHARLFARSAGCWARWRTGAIRSR